MGRPLLILVCLYLTSGLRAQTHEWSFSFGSNQFERAYGIELDPSGNVYVCGAFDEKYLELPEDVLVTVMHKDQKYFPVEGYSGRITRRRCYTLGHAAFTDPFESPAAAVSKLMPSGITASLALGRFSACV